MLLFPYIGLEKEGGICKTFLAQAGFLEFSASNIPTLLLADKSHANINNANFNCLHKEGLTICGLLIIFCTGVYGS